MPADAAAGEREIANDIEDFVPDKFIGKPERLLAEDAVAAGDDRIFQAAALDEAFVHERLHILVENKRARRRDLLFVEFRSDLRAEELREASLRPHLRAGDPEFGIGENHKHRPAGFNREGLEYFEITPRGILLDGARFENDRRVGGCAAVANRRLVGVHLDEGVVHAESGQRRENMLDSVNLHHALHERCRPLDRLDMGGGGFDNRFIRQVDALEFEAMSGGGREDRDGDVFAGVKGAAGECCGGCEGALFVHWSGYEKAIPARRCGGECRYTSGCWRGAFRQARARSLPGSGSLQPVAIR